MPTVLHLDGLRVVIYPGDHRPPHVHVMGGGCEAIFALNCPGGATTLRASFGFATRELNRIASGLDAALVHLCSSWSLIHGNN